MWKNAFKIPAVILLLTAAVYTVFYYIKTEIPSTFLLIPAYFIAASICLSIFAKKSAGSKKLLSKMLIFRFAVVLCGILILLAGLILDKNNILNLTLLFVLYYIVFSIFETQAMLKITKPKS